MQWRPYTRVFTRLNSIRPTTSRSPFTPAPKWHISRRSFHFVDGKFTTAETSLQAQPQTDWNDEVDEADDTMALQELSQLQQLLGLAEPKSGKPVEDVIFVCIDCEAFEFDQNKITEIGMSNLLLRKGTQC